MLLNQLKLPEYTSALKVNELHLELLLATGRYHQAQKLLASLKKSHPATSSLAMLQIRLQIIHGQYLPAAKALLIAIRNNRKNWLAHRLLIEVATITGNQRLLKREAGLFFRLYANNRLKTADGILAAARAVQSEDPKGAWQAYREALKLDKQNIQAAILAGKLAFEKYDWSNAKRYFKIALHLNPNHQEALTGLALVHSACCQYRKAEDMLAKALKINPNAVSSLTLKATIHLSCREYQQAETCLQSALRVNPNATKTLAVLAAYHDALGNEKQCNACIQKCLSINPTSAAPFIMLSIQANRKYQFERAQKWAMKAIKIQPDYWEGYYLAGLTLLALGEEKAGYRLLSRSFEMNRYNSWAYNMLRVLDQEFHGNSYTCRQTRHFIVRLPSRYADEIWPDLEPFLEKIYTTYSRKYDLIPKGCKDHNGKILLLMMPSPQSFAARTVGLPGINAAGLCMGRVIAMPIPADDDADSIPWQDIISHEFLHVITLQKTLNKIPRWFTEGISTYEEKRLYEKKSLALFVKMHDSGKLLDIDQLESGFNRPDVANRVFLCYMQAQLACYYLLKNYGDNVVIQMLDHYKNNCTTAQILTQVTGQSLAHIRQEYRNCLKTFVSGIKKKLKQENKANDAAN